MGKRRLERALRMFREKHGATDVVVRWRPFFLDPTLPPRVDKMTHYKQKFGAARTARMIPHMQEVGRAEGITFSYGGDMGNTLDSHRLIELAAEQGKQDQMVEALFKRYVRARRPPPRARSGPGRGAGERSSVSPSPGGPGAPQQQRARDPPLVSRAAARGTCLD